MAVRRDLPMSSLQKLIIYHCCHYLLETCQKEMVKTRLRFLKFLQLCYKCCRDPSYWEHVPRTSWWHMAHITIRITPIRIHVMRLSYPDYLKEVQATLINIRHPNDFYLISGLPKRSSNDTYKHKTSGQLSQIHPNDQHRSSGYDCPGHWLK